MLDAGADPEIVNNYGNAAGAMAERTKAAVTSPSKLKRTQTSAALAAAIRPPLMGARLPSDDAETAETEHAEKAKWGVLMSQSMTPGAHAFSGFPQEQTSPTLLPSASTIISHRSPFV